MLLNNEVLYYLMYGIFAVLATVVHPFFISFHLSEIVFRSAVMRNNIMSFWEPRSSIFLALVLMLLFNYYFSLYSYAFLNKYYNNTCDSLLVCMVVTFD